MPYTYPTSSAVFTSDEIAYATANASALAGYSGDLWDSASDIIAIANSTGTDALSRLKRFLLRIWMYILEQLVPPLN